MSDGRTTELTGGCQCGAVRYRAERLGSSAICHCRMCQKAMGNAFSTMVTGYGVAFTRGAPSWFQSSNLVERGYCSNCGTPLFYHWLSDNESMEVTVGSLDNPALAPPTKQVNSADRLDFFWHLADLPTRPLGAAPAIDAFNARVVSYQHPDHDTASWSPRPRTAPGHER